MLLKDRVAIVTGAGRGIGFGIAEAFGREGARVVIGEVVEERGQEAAEKLRAAGYRAQALPLDVTRVDSCTRLTRQVLAEHGRIDILVNNAAAPPGADRVPVVQLSEEAWDTVLDVNLKGSFLCAKAAANAMLRQKIRGRIINIGSDNSKVGQPNLAAYCASKFGLVGFTQALAMELATAGITANTICPGPMDTERVDYFGRREDGSYDESRRMERIRQLTAEVPLGRLATPEDVAQLAAFLASDAAEYVTGQAINLAGGVIMH